MKHKEILERAWKILWSYRVLWVFGIILALTTNSSSNNFNWNNSSQNNSQSREDFSLEAGDDLQEGFSQWVEDTVEAGEEFFGENLQVSDEWAQAALMVAIIGGCFFLILIIVGWIMRYVSETSLIKLVDENEQTGTRHKIREGFRMGFSRHAWHMFLANVVITLPTIAVFMLLFAVAIAPFFLWMTENVTLGIIGTVAGVGLFFLMIFFAIIVAAAFSLLRRFVFRLIALEDLGPIEAIKRSIQLVRENFKDVILMWLIMVGIGLGVGLLMIPVGFLFLILAAVFGGLLGLSVGGVTSIFADNAPSIIAGIVAGTPAFLLVLIVPLAFLSGLKETYISTTWTLTYREVLALEALESVADGGEELPELEDSSQA